MIHNHLLISGPRKGATDPGIAEWIGEIDGMNAFSLTERTGSWLGWQQSVGGM